MELEYVDRTTAFAVAVAIESAEIRFAVRFRLLQADRRRAAAAVPADRTAAVIHADAAVGGCCCVPAAAVWTADCFYCCLPTAAAGLPTADRAAAGVSSDAVFAVAA